MSNNEQVDKLAAIAQELESDGCWASVSNIVGNEDEPWDDDETAAECAVVRMRSLIREAEGAIERVVEECGVVV